MSQLLKDLIKLDDWVTNQEWKSGDTITEIKITMLFSQISQLRAKHDKPKPEKVKPCVEPEFNIDQVIKDFKRLNEKHSVLTERVIANKIEAGELVNKYEMIKLRMPKEVE